MTVVQIVGWSVIAAVAGWRLAWSRARASIEDIKARALIESRQWKAEAERWRANAAQLIQEIEAWKAGHQEGRADLINMVPLLVSARQSARQDGGTCACKTATQTDSAP